jgi:hypothetical protein
MMSLPAKLLALLKPTVVTPTNDPMAWYRLPGGRLERGALEHAIAKRASAGFPVPSVDQAVRALNRYLRNRQEP